MADILIRGYKAREQIEDLIKEARYGANNAMIGSGLKIIELPEHGDLIDRGEAIIDADERAYDFWSNDDEADGTKRFLLEQPVVIPATE